MTNNLAISAHLLGIDKVVSESLTDAGDVQSSDFLGPLPMEISEQIIDTLWDDRESLLACALTCRSWLLRSRCHLFHIIHIRKAQHLRVFSRMLLSAPHIVDLARELHVYHALDPAYTCTLSLFATMLAGRLSHIQHLRLERDYSVGPRPLPLPGRFFSALSGFGSVTKLSLYMLQFSTFADLRKLICALPNISDLRCIYLTWTTMGPVQPQAQREDRTHRPRFTSLHLDMRVEMATLADWLLSDTILTGLDKLVLSFVDIENVERLDRMTHAAGRSLRHFSVDFRSDQGKKADAARWLIAGQFLAPCTVLESLRVRFLQGVLDPGSWAEALFSAVQSTSIRRVTLGVSMWRMPVIQQEFARMANVISRPQFAHLRELEFEWTGFNRMPEDWRRKYLLRLGMNETKLLLHGQWRHSSDVEIRHLQWT